MRNIKISRQGFSLVELSVVLVIIGILIYMTLVAGAQQLEMARIKQTQFKLQKIQTALATYLKTYGYLPCPADGTAPWGDANFGIQKNYVNLSSSLSNATCSSNLTAYFPAKIYIGVVPTRTLGMPDDAMLDGWDNRITYIVSINCVDPDNWNSTNIYKCQDSSATTNNGGRISLLGKNGSTWNDAAVYLTISHGTSGNGAWSRDGVKSSASVAASNNEYSNGNLDSNGNPITSSTNGSTLYYDQPINDGDISNNYFDNITTWSTAPQIYYNSAH